MTSVRTRMQCPTPDALHTAGVLAPPVSRIGLSWVQYPWPAGGNLLPSQDNEYALW